MHIACTALKYYGRPNDMQSRIVRGLLPPLATLAVEAIAVALYETLREVNVACKSRKR